MQPFRTGIPEYDAVIESEAVRTTIARQIRYGQTRMLEAILAALMVAIGVALVSRGSTFSLPSFRVIASFVSEGYVGWISLFSGIGRLWALWMNGRQHMPAFRMAGCIGGFFFWMAWGVGLYATSPPLVPMAPAALVFVVAEFISLQRATRDAYVFNTLGFRKRKRKAH